MKTILKKLWEKILKIIGITKRAAGEIGAEIKEE
jgi:hypothetical protein